MPRSTVKAKTQSNGGRDSAKRPPAKKPRRATRAPARQNEKIMAADRGRPKAQKRDVDLDWLRDQLRRRKIKQNELARLVKMDAAAMSRAISGDRQIQLQKACDIAGALGVTVDTIAEKFGYDCKPSVIGISGAIKSDGTVTSITPAINRLVTADVFNPGAAALIFETPDGPLAAYRDGLVFYAPADGPGSHVPPDAYGRLCVVEAEGELLPMLGSLERSTKRGEVALRVFGHNEVVPLSNVLRASIVVSIRLA